MKRLGLMASFVCVSTSCSPVTRSSVRPDFATVDRTQTLRLVVVTSPLPAGSENVGHLWAGIARKWTNQHRDFLVVDDFGAATLPGDLCSDGVQGILHLAPVAALEGDGAQVQVEARLVRCTDQVEIWSAAAAGSWSSKDDDLDGVRAYWARELGEEVGPWVVPTFRLVTATLETLPEPALPNEAWVREKIELGD